MTPKERAAMQQALEALEYETSSHKSYNRKPLLSSLEAITALREALAAQAEQEPVAWLIPGSITGDKKLAEANGGSAIPLYTIPPQQTEPDCVVHNTDTPGHFAIITPALPAGTKLYTAPRQREWVEPSDEQIAKAVGDEIDSVYLADFRAVLKLAKELNHD